jgi:hypothetical protein
MFGQIADRLVGVDVDHDRADRHADLQILAVLAVHLRAHAILTAASAIHTLMAEIDQRVEI